MKRNSALSSLVHPSISSLTVGAVAVVWLLTSSLWSVAKNAPFVRDYLGDASLQSTAITNASGSISALTDSIFSSSIFNQLTYVSLWALVGVLCYFMIAFLSVGASDIRTALSVSKSSKYNRNGLQSLRDLSVAFAFRFFMTILFIFSIIVLLQFIVPVASLTIKAGADFENFGSLAYIAAGAFLCGLYLHIQLIILRLLFLRVRLFNNVDELILNN